MQGLPRDQAWQVQDFTIVGVGAFEFMESWGVRFPSGRLDRQRAGLRAVRELRIVVENAFEWDLALQEAVSAGLCPLSSYDIQVQLCEAKRGLDLCGRVASTREVLNWADHGLTPDAIPKSRKRKHREPKAAKRKAGRKRRRFGSDSSW